MWTFINKELNKNNGFKEVKNFSNLKTLCEDKSVKEALKMTYWQLYPLVRYSRSYADNKCFIVETKKIKTSYKKQL